MNAVDPHLPVTLATYTFLLRAAGHSVADAAAEAACAAFAKGERPADELGADLVAAVGLHLRGDDAAAVTAALAALFGDLAVRTDLGAGPDREARVAAIRRAHFGNHLPWLARIVDRLPGGDVGFRWVLVEAFDAAVKVMDPNPWDEQDEERELPVTDFLVQWELGGAVSVRAG